jgi:hypothetical protein
MLTVARLRKHPRHFKSFTGLSLEQFDTLLRTLSPLYQARECARKSRPGRQRAIGGGHPFSLEVLPVPMRDELGLVRSAPGEPMARKRIGTLCFSPYCATGLLSDDP